MSSVHADPAAEVRRLIGQFTHSRVPYKKVMGHEIMVDILVPQPTLAHSRDPNSKGVPLIARFHGGGLVSGASMFVDWLAPWNFYYAQRHAAVMVLPNYRLLPESDAADLMEDLTDFWAWAANHLQECISANTDNGPQIDLSKVIAMGDSAGGFFAIQSGFMASTLSPGIHIRGIVAPFPMIDLEHAWFTDGEYRSGERFRGQPIVSRALLDDHVASMQINDPVLPVSEDWKLERMKLIVAMMQHGDFTKYFIKDGNVKDEYYPMRRVRTATSFPALFIMHGRQDSVVALSGSERFMAALKERLPLSDVLLEVHDGEHGFGNAHILNDGWLSSGLAWLDKKAGLA